MTLSFIRFYDICEVSLDFSRWGRRVEKLKTASSVYSTSASSGTLAGQCLRRNITFSGQKVFSLMNFSLQLSIVFQIQNYEDSEIWMAQDQQRKNYQFDYFFNKETQAKQQQATPLTKPTKHRKSENSQK